MGNTEINLYGVSRNLGIRGLLLRSFHAFALKAGRVRHRAPIRMWDKYFAIHSNELAGQSTPCPSIFGKPQKDFLSDKLLTSAQKLPQGRLTFFSHQQFDLGYPFAWHKSPLTGKVLPPGKHWSLIPDFDPAIGDIKYLWEPSRFGWAYDLVRSYHALSQQLNDSTSQLSSRSTTQPLNGSPPPLSGSSTTQHLNDSTSYDRIFWELFEDWLTHNQPNCGVNWKCGQETAIRAMALCFSLINFWNSSSSTTQRKTKLILTLRFHAERIMATRLYALSQNNNHALSEAAGLITIGALFPFFPESQKWFRIGFKQFCNEIMRQIYADGAYIQHSFNYHRLMLQLATWVDCILRATNRNFPVQVRNRLAVSTSFLASFVDDKTGCVPNYGNNDGANLLPLSSCDYTDYRPTIQAASVAFLGKPQFAPGPYDEMSHWLNLSFPSSPINPCSNPVILSTPSSLDSTTQHLNSSTSSPGSTSQQLNISTARFALSGYYILKKNSYSIFTRCHSYKHRPGHADALHVDIWRNGQCVFGDSGTFSYLCRPEDDFSTTASHNTIRIGDQDQMIRISRFMWGAWAKAGLTTLVEKEDYLLWEGWHTGYLRRFGVTHRRAIFLPAQESACIIVDKLESDRPIDFELLWHMHAMGNEDWLQCHIRVGKSHWSPLELSTSVGHHATYYGSKEEHKLLSIEKNAAMPTTIISVIGHDPALKETVAQGASTVIEHFEILPLLNDREKGPILKK